MVILKQAIQQLNRSDQNSWEDEGFLIKNFAKNFNKIAGNSYFDQNVLSNVANW